MSLDEQILHQLQMQNERFERLEKIVTSALEKTSKPERDECTTDEAIKELNFTRDLLNILRKQGFIQHDQWRKQGVKYIYGLAELKRVRAELNAGKINIKLSNNFK